MLVIKRGKMNRFVTNNETKIREYMRGFVPSLLVEVTDDVDELINRIFDSAKVNGFNNLALVHKTKDTHIVPEDIQFVAAHMMAVAGKVTLRKEIFEPHVEVQPTGEFKRILVPVPQVMTDWIISSSDNKTFVLDNSVYVTPGDRDLVQSWKIK